MAITDSNSTAGTPTEDIELIINGLLKNIYRINAIFEIGNRLDIVNTNDVDELTMVKMAIENGHQSSGILLDLMEDLQNAFGKRGELAV